MATILEDITLYGVLFTSWPDLLLAWPNLELKDFWLRSSGAYVIKFMLTMPEATWLI